MSAYWIARCHVTDPAKFSEYAGLAGPIIENHGGKFLARGGYQIEVEGGSYERTVLVEFKTMEAAKACYNSCDYQEALKIVTISSERHVVLIEGLSINN